MPYSIPNPTAMPALIEPEEPHVELSPTEGAVLDEMRDEEARALLEKQVKELRHPIQLAARELEEEAGATLMKTPGVAAINAAARSVRAAWNAFSASERQLANDLNLTAIGRDEANKRNAEKRDAAIEAAVQKGPSDGGDSVLMRFPARPLSKLDVATSAEVSVIFAGFPHLSARGFISEAIEVLRAAADPATSETERKRLNDLLRRGYGPLASRRSVKPERFARSLQSVNADLHELIEAHLATADQTVAHDVAVEFVSEARTSFGWIVEMARQQNGWDDFALFLGSPIFEWEKS